MSSRLRAVLLLWRILTEPALRIGLSQWLIPDGARRGFPPSIDALEETVTLMDCWRASGSLTDADLRAVVELFRYLITRRQAQRHEDNLRVRQALDALRAATDGRGRPQ